MANSLPPSIELRDVEVIWPNGDVLFRDLHAIFPLGSTGLIGDNGAGKSTILALIAGHLRPQAGTVAVSGEVGMLSQRTPIRSQPVADLLGIGTKIRAIEAIEAGSADPALFDIVGLDWDLHARAAHALSDAGLGHITDLHREITTVSGGEAMLLALIGLQLGQPPIVLLDEPSNMLDRPARHRLYDLIEQWGGERSNPRDHILIVASHDRDLLNHMAHTAEVHEGQLRFVRGGFEQFESVLAAEQAAAEAAIGHATTQWKRQRRERIEAETKLARRQRSARKSKATNRYPKIVANQRATEAQVSAGKLREQHRRDVDTAADALSHARERLRRDQRIHIDLPATVVPSRRRILQLRDAHGYTVDLTGPERVALSGRNGSGKTTLLETILAGGVDPLHGIDTTRFVDAVGYLPQRVGGAAEEQQITVYDYVQGTVQGTVQRSSAHRSREALHAKLAQFHFRGDDLNRTLGTLSGGERFRAELARLLLADPAPQLLILDEPTNALDMTSVEQLRSALASFQGALLIVSHDSHVLNGLNITRNIELAEGRLRSVPA